MTILQFHVALMGITPRIWRRIEIRANGTFWDLHCAGIPDPDYDEDRQVLPGWKVKLSEWHLQAPMQYEYRYDFGDDWVHRITLESIGPAVKGVRYPRCTAGERRCPPEDVGGPDGYARFLAELRSSSEERRRELEEWTGVAFDPELFDSGRVRFTDPRSRLTSSGVLEIDSRW
jgi:hypothetical protein